MTAEESPIPVTQYLRPDGRTRQITISRPMRVAVMADALLDLGYEFEAEMLSTGEISQTLVDPGGGVDQECEVCSNGPEVPEAFDRLVRAGYLRHCAGDGEKEGEEDA